MIDIILTSLLGSIVLGLIALAIYSRFTVGRCKSHICLVGKTAIVTGGNSGIGFQTALALAARGCRVIIADKVDAEESKKKIIELSGNTNILTKFVDLASLKSVKDFSQDISETEKRLDILVNNAGVNAVGNRFSADGLHLGMQVNHFGPFLLTHCLADLLKKTAPSRVIFVSSYLAFVNNLTVDNLNYPLQPKTTLLDEMLFYGNSKLCNIISARGFAERLEKYGVTVNALHPGLVATPIYKTGWKSVNINQILITIFYSTFLKLYGKTPEEGAQTSIHLCVAKEVEKVTGKFFADCKPCRIPSPARNEEFCTQIWESSEAFVKLKPDERLIHTIKIDCS